MPKIEDSFNGHLPNCVCDKCHKARQLLMTLRGKINLRLRLEGDWHE